MIRILHSLGIIIVMSAVTILLRYLPFIFFGRNNQPPQWLNYLGKYLPCAIMAFLVVYCLKDVSLFSSSHGIPEFVSVAVAAILHFWKKNPLLSIGISTALYMFLVQKIF